MGRIEFQFYLETHFTVVTERLDRFSTSIAKRKAALFHKAQSVTKASIWEVGKYRVEP